MKPIAIYRAAGFLILAAFAQGQSNAPRVFQGEVSDSQCALNVHSLTRTCSLFCIEHLGGDLVLVSGKDGKDVYHLDRADLVHGFEGQKVKITGVLDSKNSHLHVLKIELEGQS
jgi:hypothetical protein